MFAATQSNPELIAALAELPMSELERAPGGAPSWRGFTPLHELISTLTDQVAELRNITTATANLVNYQGPQRYIQRPDSPVEAAKKIRVRRERTSLDDKINRLQSGGDS